LKDVLVDLTLVTHLLVPLLEASQKQFLGVLALSRLVSVDLEILQILRPTQTERQQTLNIKATYYKIQPSTFMALDLNQCQYKYALNGRSKGLCLVIPYPARGCAAA